MTTQELEYLIKVNDRDLRELKGRIRDTNKELGDGTSSASRKGSSGFGKIGKAAKFLSIGLGAGVGGLAFAAKIGFDEFREGEKVAAQTRATLKSTGGAARVTADDVGELASTIGDYSTLGDEAVQQGENLLLTFTNIRNEAGRGNDIFTQTTRIMADMSVALGQDTSSSAIQLGKALNDPIKGVTALQRVGVSFTEQQREQIKKMVESGDTMGAQKLILAELNKEFGGSAKAAGETFGGQITRAKNKLEDFAGEMVARAIPHLQTMISWLRDHWPEIQAAISEFWSSVRPTLEALAELAMSIVQTIREHWGTIGPILEDVVRVIQAQLEIVADVIRVFAAILRGDWGAAWEAIKDLVGHAFEAIKAIIRLEKDLLVAIVRGVGTAMKNAIVHAVTGVAGDVWGLIQNIGDKVTEKLAAIREWGENVGSRIKSGAVSAITGVAGDVWGIVNNVGATIAEKAGDILGWGKSVGAKIKEGIKDALRGVGAWVVSEIRSAINALIDRVNDLLEFSIEVDTHIPGVGKKSITIDPRDIPHLATGGRLRAGQPAIVGERGEELFVPDESGTIVPNHALGRLAGVRGLFEGATFIVREPLDAELVAASVSARLATLAPA